MSLHVKTSRKSSFSYFQQEGAASPVPPLLRTSSVATDFAFETAHHSTIVQRTDSAY